jgi:hypothetical protein
MGHSECLHWNLHDLRTSSNCSDHSIFKQIALFCVINNIYDTIMSISGQELCFTHLTGITNDTHIATQSVPTINYSPLLFFEDKQGDRKRFKIVIKKLNGRNCIIDCWYFVQCFKCFIKIGNTNIEV